MANMRSWFYAEGQQNVGPMGHHQLEALIASGRISRTTLVWTEGMANWEQAERHFVFASDTTPPPLPGALGLDTSGASDKAIGIDGLYVGSPSRSFGQAISVCMRKYFTFAGRASRSEYWFFILFTVLVGMVTTVLDATVFGTALDDYGPTNSLAYFVLFIPTLSAGWRRLHDTDRSGWWIGGFWVFLIAAIAMLAFMYDASGLAIGTLMVLMAIAFLVWMVVVLVFFCAKGHLQPNRYG
jgi:uncharacterized membrane protein YhaH (DUF805 family)